MLEDEETRQDKKIKELESRIRGLEDDRIADIHEANKKNRREAQIMGEDLNEWCSYALINLLVYIRNSNPEAYFKARIELDSIKRGD